MTEVDPIDLIRAGWAALQAADWLRARQYFDAALAELDSPEGPPDVAALVASLQAYGTDTLGPPPGLPFDTPKG